MAFVTEDGFLLYKRFLGIISSYMEVLLYSEADFFHRIFSKKTLQKALSFIPLDRVHVDALFDIIVN